MINIKTKYIIFIILFVIHSFGVANEITDYKIDNRIILQKGLSQSRVQSIIEDSRGFMWFGTADGLNRYDGYTFKIFRNNPNDSTSLGNNNINSMVEDNQGNIWIATSNGIVVFNPFTEIFQSIKDTESITTSNNASFISSCVLDNHGYIWYSTKDNAIFKINTSTHKKEQLIINPTDSISFVGIEKLYIDKSNRLWFDTYYNKAIFAYNINDNTFEYFTLSGITNKDKLRFKVNAIFEDYMNRIWISVTDYQDTSGSLFYLEKGKKTFNNYKKHISKKNINDYIFHYNTIECIIGDDKEIWFASNMGGIFKFEFGNTPTAYFMQSPFYDATINCIYKSKNDILWIGTNGKGIEISIVNNTDFKLMNTSINNEFTIESIRTFCEDDEHYWVGGYFGLSKIKKDFSEISTADVGNIYTIANSANDKNVLWTGSEGGGLIPYNKITNKLSKVLLNYKKENISIYNHVYVIRPINDTLLLLGAFTGLYGYNPKSKTFTAYPAYCNLTKREIIKPVRTIYKDKSGNILIGFTQGGIGQVNFNKNRIEKFTGIPQSENSNNYNPTNCIYNDDKNRYWIATNNGLIMHDLNNKSYQFLTESDGLPNSHIYGILPDEEGKLWLSTNIGLSCYDPDNKKFTNYDVSDGLQNNEFNTGAYFKAKDGTMFFGGISGFNYFNPKQIKQNSIIPTLVITDIKISNKSINIDKQETNKKEIIIHPYDDSFSIEFAGLSFINSKNNSYKYRLKELNSNWIDMGTVHRITFNSIDPGTYTLEILASNNHGLWLKKPFSITIIVIPTFYESNLFKWIMAILIILVVFIIYKARVKQITNQKDRVQVFADLQTVDLRVTNDTLSKEILKHKATSKALAASNKTKDKFLSIMAHDIINPLGVILGFSDLLIDEANNFNKEDQTSFLKTINTTTKGLTALLSNLLQWSRIQNETITSKPQNISLNNQTSKSINLLNGNILEKKITIRDDSDNSILVNADPDMLSTILRNLLSNAIKFTPIMGKITIKTEVINNMVEIRIIDNGVGILKENISKLFNPNDNISTKGTNNESGTGLGLGLVYEFVTMNNGKIWVKSEVGKGSEFIFTLPIVL